MIALAVINLVRLQLDVVGQFKVLQRGCELHRVGRLLLVRDQRKAHRRGVAEPVPRGRHVAVVDLSDIGDEFFDAGNARLLPIPFEHPDTDARFRRQCRQRFQLLLRPRHVDLLVEAELHHLLEAVDHVGALYQKDQHVRAGCARLDQIGGEIRGAERRQLVAGDGAAELLQIIGAGVIERVAEGVIGRDEVPFLAILGKQDIRHRIGFHPRRVADAEHIPLAILAGDRIGVAAGHDVQDLLFRGDLGDRSRDP